MSGGGCLVCLVGLPGSGKTLLASRLAGYVSREGGGEAEVAVVSYDLEMPWSEEDTEEWRARRRRLAERAEEEAARGAAVLLDDNMYYRSMREEYRKAARRRRLGFCQVYLEAGAEAAGERNRRRGEGAGRVPEEVVARMAARLEPPDPLRFPWERRTLVVRDAAAPDAPRTLLLFLLEAAAHPLSPPASPLPPRPPPAPSPLHTADLALRTLVKERASVRPPAPLNLLRKSLLARIKQGSLSLPPTDSRSQEETYRSYYSFLSTFFEQ